MHPVARVRVRWLSAAEGGRAAPPDGPTYAATACFTDAADDFSVALRLGPPSNSRSATGDAELRLLAPDNLPEIVAKLTPGSRLYLKEGRQNVAECQVLSARMEATERPIFSG